MTATTATRGTHTPEAPAGGLPDLGDPGERGRLEIADRVVERIAGYAVKLAPGATAAPRRVLGVNVGAGGEQEQAHVDARVDGGVATVDATIAVGWPASVRQVAQATRRQIRDEVERISGVVVDYIDLDVVSLRAPQRPHRRLR